MNTKRRRLRRAVSALITLLALVAYMRVAVAAERIGDVPEDTKMATYVIQSGDTLTGIAAKVDPGVNPQMFADYVTYHDHLGDTLQVGESIIIPIGGK